MQYIYFKKIKKIKKINNSKVNYTCTVTVHIAWRHKLLLCTYTTYLWCTCTLVCGHLALYPRVIALLLWQSLCSRTCSSCSSTENCIIVKLDDQKILHTLNTRSCYRNLKLGRPPVQQYSLQQKTEPLLLNWQLQPKILISNRTRWDETFLTCDRKPWFTNSRLRLTVRHTYPPASEKPWLTMFGHPSLTGAHENKIHKNWLELLLKESWSE